MLFNPPPVKIPMTKEEMQYFFHYLSKCYDIGFTGIHDYKFKADREYFIKYHLKELANKIFNKLMKLHFAIGTKKISISVSEAERYSLMFLFKRVDCDPYILSIQQRFINQLTPIA